MPDSQHRTYDAKYIGPKPQALHGRDRGTASNGQRQNPQFASPHPQQGKAKNYSNPNGSHYSVNSEEYDFVEGEVKMDETVLPTPTEHFPNTWDAAYHDTSAAYTEVSKATRSFCISISNSGLGKAGWTIGGALARTVNYGTAKAAGYAMHASGADTGKLPYSVQNWLRRKDEVDMAKKRAEERAKDRKARRESPSSKVQGRSEQFILRNEEVLDEEFEDLGANCAADRQRRSSQMDICEEQIRTSLDKFTLADDSDDEMDECDQKAHRAGSNQTAHTPPGHARSRSGASKRKGKMPAANDKIKTPGHTGTVFEHLDAPASVRTEVSKGLTISPQKWRPFPALENVEESNPYLHNYEDEDDSEPITKLRGPTSIPAHRRPVLTARSSASSAGIATRLPALLTSPSAPFSIGSLLHESEASLSPQEVVGSYFPRQLTTSPVHKYMGISFQQSKTGSSARQASVNPDIGKQSLNEMNELMDSEDGVGLSEALTEHDM